MTLQTQPTALANCCDPDEKDACCGGSGSGSCGC